MAALLIAVCVLVSVTVAAGELVRATIARMLTAAPAPDPAPVSRLRRGLRQENGAA